MVFCRTQLCLHLTAPIWPVAQNYITPALLNHLNYVGVLTLELFVTDKGLYANEMAPRVHARGTGQLKVLFAHSLKTTFVRWRAYL